ncbi:metal-sensing transcriptional repressor [Eubacterium oxidoreducens]|uniref:DNA-binding transcriptional regulator, FrmR family n=1 Tax=Eubacterium oxidoreducens TaxID=1732 RepID=A0A1G6CDM5_EUBOX|nr:metal-sensing transcriptional repressor [Eubacterium oxidoreducens]SDB30998.1 DNA-binding transcriptional regulator, FrmR family [Eubacterium oxidoreducens]
MSETKPCCNERTKVRGEKEYKDLMNRLSRIEGQVRGVKKMLESDTYCIDILTQMSAISSAVASFNNKLLENHIRSCVIHDIKDGNDEVIDELVTVLQKLMKN